MNRKSNSYVKMFLCLLVFPLVFITGCGGGSGGAANTTPPTPGSLDTSFNEDGIVTTPVGTSIDQATSVAVQPDGKIVVAGCLLYGSQDVFAVVRYNSNGALDTSFDGDGMVTTPIGSGPAYARSVAIQPDGKIIVVGHTGQITNGDFAVVRYNANGSLDTSFNGDGVITTPIGTGHDEAHSVAIQSDGKIIAAGYAWNGLNYDFALARYNADGSLDTSFDGDGIVTTDSGLISNFTRCLAIQADGKIIAAGYSTTGSNSDFTIVRYNTDGALDTSFDGDGIVTTELGSTNDTASSVAIQSDGKIIAAGSLSNGFESDFAVVRYNTNGSLDASFDGDGIATTPIGTSADADGVVIQTDGKIVAVGSTLTGTNFNYAVVRYNANGSLDTSFDDDGVVTTELGTDEDEAHSVALQSDGKILVAGYSGTFPAFDFTVVRYNP